MLLNVCCANAKPIFLISYQSFAKVYYLEFKLTTMKGVHMKSIISLGLLIVSVGYAQMAIADCKYPKMNVDIPDGSKATMEDMVSDQSSFKAYNADMDVYLQCLDDELALVSEELDIYPDLKKANNLKYDAAVDVLTQAADEWNQAVRDYKAQ